MALCLAFLAFAATTPAAATSSDPTSAAQEGTSEDFILGTFGSRPYHVEAGTLCLNDMDEVLGTDSQVVLLNWADRESESESYLSLPEHSRVPCPDGEVGDPCEDSGRVQMACIILKDPGQTASSCSEGGFSCAQAMAHAEYEEVAGMPNLYSHMTGGHGMNPNGLSGGTTDIQTSLGSTTCSFGPGDGCGATWSDAASTCKNMWAIVTVTTIGLPARAAAADYNCH